MWMLRSFGFSKAEYGFKLKIGLRAQWRKGKGWADNTKPGENINKEHSKISLLVQNMSSKLKGKENILLMTTTLFT